MTNREVGDAVVGKLRRRTIFFGSNGKNDAGSAKRTDNEVDRGGYNLKNWGRERTYAIMEVT